MTDIALNQPNLLHDYSELHELLHTELRHIEGAYYCTVRGLARLIEISPSSLTDSRRQAGGLPMGTLLKVKECSVDLLPRSLKPIAGFDFKNYPNELRPNSGAYCLLPEPVVAHIIKYYAYDCPKRKPRALQLDSLLSSIGVRTFFSKIIDCTESTEIIETSGTASLVPTNKMSVDERAKVISDLMSNLTACSVEFKEKALLTLLGII